MSRVGRFCANSTTKPLRNGWYVGNPCIVVVALSLCRSLWCSDLSPDNPRFCASRGRAL